MGTEGFLSLLGLKFLVQRRRLVFGCLLDYFIKHQMRFSRTLAVAVIHAAAALRKTCPIRT